MRTFIAIEMDKAVVEKLEAIRHRLQKADADVKWVEPENSHLTIKFIGEIDPAKVDAIKAEMQQAAVTVKPFELAVHTAGSFPKGRPPRVLWVGVHDASGSLARLHAELENGLAKLGIEPEGREFAGHLTLGRVRSRKNVRKLAEMLAAENPAELGSSHVDGLTLFESKLDARGPKYTALAHIQLG